MWSVWNAHYPCALLLLPRTQDVNLGDVEGKTVLMQICSKCNSAQATEVDVWVLVVGWVDKGVMIWWMGGWVKGGRFMRQIQDCTHPSEISTVLFSFHFIQDVFM